MATKQRIQVQPFHEPLLSRYMGMVPNEDGTFPGDEEEANRLRNQITILNLHVLHGEENMIRTSSSVPQATMADSLPYIRHVVTLYGFVLAERDPSLETSCQDLADAIALAYDLQNPHNAHAYCTLLAPDTKDLKLDRPSKGDTYWKFNHK